jgi:multidrug efflux pump subunit AcrB
MNLIHSSLRRPFTVIVASIAITLGAGLALRQMTRDIFPSLGIPTIYVAQPFGGMDPAQMEGYLTYYYEYHFLYITGIEHVESKSIQGASVIKLQFHPGMDMSQAMAETISYVNRARAFMPPGTVPPFVMRFDAGSVPVGQLVFSSETRTVGQLQDAALNLVRPLFATLPGVSAPPPFGGSARSIVINLKPDRLHAYNLTPEDIVASVASANVISPSGNATVGNKYPMVPINSVVKNIKDLESVPVRTGTRSAVFLRDVAQVADGSDIVTCYALVNGRRTVYIPVTKRSDASTLSVVNLVKANLAKFQSVLPDDVKVSYEFDQSPYVTHAINGLVREGLLGAILTGLMVLLFLRDWRSSFIVIINIPLSLFASLFAIWICKQNINIMTLGGLALAVGILVDEATVTIENIHTHLVRKKGLAVSVYEATTETITPRLLAMLCVLAVFIPAFFMTGAAKALFVPLALAVSFSMIGSYLLSSTLVPILSVWLLRHHEHFGDSAFFFRVQNKYRGFIGKMIAVRWALLIVYVIVAGALIFFVGRHLGTEIFPKVEVGQLALRVRAPAGTKLDETEALAKQALNLIRDEVGSNNVEMTLGFVGVHAPSYPINLIYQWNSGPEEASLQVQFNRGLKVKIEQLKDRLRERFAWEMPEVKFSFEPSDIVSRVMSFGSPTPIEIAISGPNLAASREFADKVRESLSKIKSLRDIQFGQSLDYPTINVEFNRERGGLLGIKTADAVRSLVPATSSSRFTVPIYWADPNSGVSYQIQVQVPQTNMVSLEDIENVTVPGSNGKSTLLRNVAVVTNGTAVGEYDRYNMQRMITVTANIADADLGTVLKQVHKSLQELGEPPARVSVAVRGQATALEQLLKGLSIGLLLAVVVIFLLLTANFQSIRLPLVVVSTVPAVIAGVVVALWVTGTTLNIQSFMGTIMAVGVAVANAILLVTFAERSRLSGASSEQAAAEGATSRMRPILMTSFAMIAGMLPMAAGFGEGAEQVAPLGRAVVGGLLAATVATLIILPSVFAIAQGKRTTRSASLSPLDPESEYYMKPPATNP